MVSRIGLDAWLSFVVWGWLAGVTLLLARFAGGCWRVHRLRVAALAEAVSPWQAASERLAARLRLTVAFRVVESGLVDAPSVIGWMRPVILLPVAVLTNLAPIQIEAILAHELAHIRRRDYAVNLLQTVAETLLFYHPGVWWVSARVREEREHCCDDVAVEVCGEPTAYAAALAELASWRTRRTAHWRLARPMGRSSRASAGCCASRRTTNLGPSAGWSSWRWACCWPPASPFSRLRSSRAATASHEDGGAPPPRLASLSSLRAAVPGPAPARSAGSGRVAATQPAAEWHISRPITLKSTTNPTWTCTPSASGKRRSVHTSRSAPT